MVGAKEAAAAWRAGQAAWHGWSLIAEWTEVSRGECLAWVRVPMVTPVPTTNNLPDVFPDVRNSES